MKWITVPLTAFILSRLLIIVISSGSMVVMPLQENQIVAPLGEEWERQGFESIWYRWDTPNYIEIVEEGYSFESSETGSISTISWFPVFPALIAMMTPVFGNPVRAGLVINNLFSLLSFLLLYRLILRDTGNEDVANVAIYALAFFPTSLFFFAAYTEGLFLFLSLCVVLLARQQHWIYSGIIGSIATATRLQGVMIIGLLGMEWLQSLQYSWDQLLKANGLTTLVKRVRQNYAGIIAVAIVPLGLVAFMLYQWNAFDTPFAFLISSNQNNIDIAGNPIATIIRDLRAIKPTNAYGVLLGISSIFLVIITIPVMWKKLPPSYSVYTGVSILLPLWSGPLDSIGRYVLVLFPVFIVLGYWLQNQVSRFAYFTFSSALLAISTILFTRWFFVG